MANQLINLERITEDNLLKDGVSIFRDKHTDVLYFVFINGYKGGITPIAEPDGTFLTYQEWKERNKTYGKENQERVMKSKFSFVCKCNKRAWLVKTVGFIKSWQEKCRIFRQRFQRIGDRYLQGKSRISYNIYTRKIGGKDEEYTTRENNNLIAVNPLVEPKDYETERKDGWLFSEEELRGDTYRNFRLPNFRI